MRTLRPALALVVAAATLCLAAAAQAAQAAQCHLPDLHWLTGVWRSDTPDTESEERWVAGPWDRLMGSSWSLHTNRAGGLVEAETIQATDAGAVALTVRHFTADLAASLEDRTSPMIFVAADCAPNTVVFDGQGDHAGEHISYRRAADTLTFTGDFLRGGKPVQVVVQFTRGGE